MNFNYHTSPPVHSASGRKQKEPKPRVTRVLMIFVILAALGIVFYIQNNTPSVLEDGVFVHFVDVGQGDAIILQSGEYAILIDAGPPVASNALLNYINEIGISRFNLIVLTHPHSDHIGGAAAVLRRFGADEVWIPDVVHSTSTFENLLDAIEAQNLNFYNPETGDVFLAGELSLFVVLADHNANETNNASIVLRLVYGETSFLFTGDMEASAERKAIAGDVELLSDVLKIAHHGSRTSSTDAFLDAVNPRVAVISLGANNRFGHPHPTVMERLNLRQIPVLRLDELGTIVLFTDGNNIYAEN